MLITIAIFKAPALTAKEPRHQSSVVIIQLCTYCSSFYLPRIDGSWSRACLRRGLNRTSCMHTERTVSGAANALTIWASETDTLQNHIWKLQQLLSYSTVRAFLSSQPHRLYKNAGKLWLMYVLCYAKVRRQDFPSMGAKPHKPFCPSLSSLPSPILPNPPLLPSPSPVSGGPGVVHRNILKFYLAVVFSPFT